MQQLHGREYVVSFEMQSDSRLRRLIRHVELEENYSVVDFACGDGKLMNLISSRVYSYVGVDFSTPFIESAKEKLKKSSISNAEFVCSDIVDFCNIHHNQFDAAFALDFSEHVYDDDLIEILVSIRKTIKAGGKLYLHTPNGDFFVEKMKSSGFILKQFPEHVAVRTLSHNLSLLESAGFKVVKTVMLPHYNMLKFIHPLAFLPGVGRFFQARIFVEAGVRR